MMKPAIRSSDPLQARLSRSRVRLILLGGLTQALGWVAGCDNTAHLVQVPRCEADDECATGLCLDGLCTERTEVDCDPSKAGPILQPSPPQIDFGFSNSGVNERTLVLRNIGDCTLTLFEGAFDSGTESPFTCPLCSSDRFPLELFPFREHEFTVSFTPREVGNYEDVLVLSSDDPEFPELRVPVRARFDGMPVPALTPNPVDFGYAPAGRTVARSLRITNQGSGNAPLEITSLTIDTATASAFSIATELEGSVSLDPVSVDRNAAWVIDLRYHPGEVETHSGDLVLITNAPGDGIVRLPLLGSSETGR